MSFVLVFPASFPDLGIKVRVPAPLSAATSTPYQNDDPEAVFGMRPVNWFDTRQSTANPGIARFLTLQVFDVPGFWSGLWHAVVFILGYLMEIAAVLVYLIKLQKDKVLMKWWQVYILVALVVSGMCFIGFCLTQGAIMFPNWPILPWFRAPKQVQLCLEVYAIFLIIMAVITLSFGEGNLTGGFATL